MRQILQHPRSGELELADVPAPTPTRGQVLVRTRYSVVSPGTEKLALEFARSSLLGKARSRPDLVKQVARKLRQEGPLPTYRAVTSRLDTPQPLGYSSAGIVEEVGEGVQQFAPGDLVACAGAGYANHAEFAVVPENLAARVPENVELHDAAFATLGAIALQGLRVAAPTLGEIAAVIGLGLIGQLTAQLLRANGCRVLGIDLDEVRVKQARDQGAEWGARPDDDFEAWRIHATGGHGADLCSVTASAANADPLRLAAGLCRMKGRIAIVGAVPIEAERRTLYEKELELRMSTSYGPGRYDRSYEEEGLDYPFGYVRWTENRNLQAFLHLLARGDLRLDRLDTEIVPFEEAVPVYEELARNRRRALALIYRYGEGPDRTRTLTLHPPTPRQRRRSPDDLGVAFLGAGNYAKAVLLPLVCKSDRVRLVSVVTANGASAKGTAARFGFEKCGTDPNLVFEDPTVELVFVATRHDTHAPLAEKALRAGKAVWLEKPAGLTPKDLALLEASVRETQGFLAIGYNRRFSPHGLALRKAFQKRHGPMAIRYSVAAGPTPAGTWYTDPEVGGGRIVGEMCHFVDLCGYLVGAAPSTVFAHSLGPNSARDDSLVALLGFADQSIATIEYLAHASSRVPKERIEISAGGSTALSDNFRLTRVLGSSTLKTRNQDKGQADAIATVVKAVREGDPSPFAIDEVLAVSRATFAIRKSATTRERVSLADSLL